MLESILKLIQEAENYFNSREHEKANDICMYLILRHPKCLEAYFLAGNIAFSSSKWLEASAYYKKAIEIDGTNPTLLNNYALCLLELFRNSKSGQTNLILSAIKTLETALNIPGDHLSILINLGLSHKELGDHRHAENYYQQALQIEPNNSEILVQLGSLFSASFSFENALYFYQQALKNSPPDPAEILCRIATLYGNIGEFEISDNYFKSSVEKAGIVEQKRHFASNRLFHLHYMPNILPEEIAAAHRNWGETYFPQTSDHPFSGSPEPDRTIRIGYVSGDFRMNAVSFFIQPVLAAHDQKRFKVFCYSNLLKKDIVTEQLIKHHNFVWREIAGISDDEAYQMIRNDKIDILVDLSGHSSEHRLPLFGLRPAAIQATWIGYPDTTGLRAMDYRITDYIADPPGLTEHLHTEELLRLPNSFLCYNPGRDFPEEGSAPFYRNGHITFGTLSNFCKINETLLDIWCRIMANVPGSQLLLRFRGVDCNKITDRLINKLKLHGIADSRLIIFGHARSVVEQMKAYRDIDIALDTFPYHGTTTTCEALYMGVPVITLAGRSHFSRVGASLLETVGLNGFIANSAEEYIEKAVALASNRDLIKALRENLRKIMMHSPLCDNVTFTAELEKAYREIWIRWCNKVIASNVNTY